MQHLLFQACAIGDTITFLRLHQENGSVLDQRTAGSQDTPLHLASRFNHKDLASVIINLQPYMVMTRNEEEETPLHEACRVGGLDIVEQLLNHCPFLAYWRNRAKESALLIACSRGHSQVAFKLANTMPSLAWDESGSLACLLMAASEGETDIVKKILRESPSLAKKKDENGFSALHLASRNGKLEVIKEFLGKYPNLSSRRENDGRTPLHWAVISGQLPVVQEFLLERDRPASFDSVLSIDLINRADNNGDTVLHLAAKMKSTEFKFVLVDGSLHPRQREVKNLASAPPISLMSLWSQESSLKGVPSLSFGQTEPSRGGSTG
ncbi:ankyrin repeat-containing-like protein [Cinnamomum micranthum f. kanehirae]|uniref:Ankyrin repeat-containing-like protein n=1 Tax=Cinnamomum micranthum f. kanehirae TaxID=337451 RepID=A0A3S3MJR1_9MAGN|nr:ankyrin repeat-containing-like protein [Cinnamomum micranthum f. kanehirae]